jgi:DNA-binding MarR family transcriptional regulator
VCRRASARRHVNAWRTFLATQRRVQVLELLIERGGLQRGVQSAIARRLGVHRSVISKDLKRLWGDEA